MVTSKKNVVKKNTNTGIASLEEKLWSAADKLRGHVEASEYKHIVLGLIFLKYISDAVEDCHENPHELPGISAYQKNDKPQIAFCIPEKARWSYLEANTENVELASMIDHAMTIVEKANESLQGIFPKNYARLSQHNHRLGELIALIGTLGLGDRDSRSKDMLGRVYEYFLGRFASAEGKGGEFYTPSSVVKLLVDMIEPYKGSVYDPCCGSGGMFVQSEKFVLAHGGKREDISIYGQEINPTTWRLCKMNLAMRDIDGDIGLQPADSFHHDLHSTHKADFILANPPFNVSDWGAERLRQDTRWQYGLPPATNANSAWIQHIAYHLAPRGVAAYVLTNGSLSGNQESNIRQALIEADLVDCIVALPPNLFYNTQIASCIWILANDKQDARFRDRRKSTLFMYAYNFGRMTDRVHRELSDSDIELIVNTYHTWRSRDYQNVYKDKPGFCKSVTVDEICSHHWSLIPGRYVGFDRYAIQQWDNEHLRMELEEAETRLAEISKASASAISILKELIYG